MTFPSSEAAKHVGLRVQTSAVQIPALTAFLLCDFQQVSASMSSTVKESSSTCLVGPLLELNELIQREHLEQGLVIINISIISGSSSLWRSPRG